MYFYNKMRDGAVGSSPRLCRHVHFFSAEKVEIPEELKLRGTGQSAIGPRLLDRLFWVRRNDSLLDGIFKLMRSKSVSVTIIPQIFTNELYSLQAETVITEMKR